MGPLSVLSCLSCPILSFYIMHFSAILSNYNGMRAYTCCRFIPTTAFLVFGCEGRVVVAKVGKLGFRFRLTDLRLVSGLELSVDVRRSGVSATIGRQANSRRYADALRERERESLPQNRKKNIQNHSKYNNSGRLPDR